MSKYFGIPGPGGSLGTCAVCGRSFMAEVLTGKPVESFTIQGIEHEMFAHDACVTTLKEIGTDWTKLPDGPLRKVFEESHATA